jgi:hypothetical protein
MVTTSKTCNRIHPCFFQRGRKLYRIKLRTDAIDRFTRVEIKVYLTKTKVKITHI